MATIHNSDVWMIPVVSLQLMEYLQLLVNLISLKKLSFKKKLLSL